VALQGSNVIINKTIGMKTTEQESQAWPFSTSPTQDQENETDRMKYMNSKLSLDMQVLANVGSFVDPPPPPAGSIHKVAFLFMLMDEINWPKIWEQFFYDAPSSSHYSIYVHRAGYQDLASAPRHPMADFGAVAVPWVNTSWCALLGLEVVLLQAALQDPLNEQFVFLSQDTVPLKNFGYVYQDLIHRSPQKSKMCFANEARHHHAILEQIGNEVKRRCCFRDFYRVEHPRTLKHHQWIVLAKGHAKVIVNRAREGLNVWKETWKIAAPDLTTMGEGCSDEGVPATTLLYDVLDRNASVGDAFEDLESIGVEQRCLTFVHWYNCFRNTNFSIPGWGITDSVRYRGADLYRYLFDKTFDFVHDSKMNGFPTRFETLSVQYLSEMTQQDFMFARKFAPDLVVQVDDNLQLPFEEILPLLWGQVDPSAAHKARWSRLAGDNA